MGTVPQLATFIVSASLLAIGFGAATSTVSQTGDMGRAFVGMVDKQRKTWMSRLQRAPITVGKVAGRGVAAAGRGAFNLVDRKYGVSNAFGRGVAGGVGASSGFVGRAGGVVGSAMRVIPGVGAVAATGLAGAALSRRKGLLGADTKAMNERMGQLDQLPAADRARALRNMRGSTGLGRFLDDAVMGPTLLMRQHEELSKPEMRKELLKQFEAEQAAILESEAIKALPEGVTELSGDTKQQIKARAGALAQEKLRQEENERLARLQAIATTSNDTPQADALKKEVENRMAYANDAAGNAAYAKRVEELLKDPSKMKDLDESVQKSGRFALALLDARKITDGVSKKPDEVLLEELRSQLKDQKELLATVDLVVKQVAGGGSTVDQITGATRREDAFKNQRLHDTTTTGRPLYSKKEFDAQTALSSATPDTSATAMFMAMDAELPFADIQRALGDKQKALDAIAEYVKTFSMNVKDDVSADAAREALSKALELAKQAGAGQEDRARIIESALTSDQAVENLMGGFGEKGAKQRKQILDITRVITQMEDIPAVANSIRYIREKVAPAQSQEVQYTDVNGKLQTKKRGGYKAMNQILEDVT